VFLKKKNGQYGRLVSFGSGTLAARSSAHQKTRLDEACNIAEGATLSTNPMLNYYVLCSMLTQSNQRFRFSGPVHVLHQKTKKKKSVWMEPPSNINTVSCTMLYTHLDKSTV
jgi:hypothetical protein